MRYLYIAATFVFLAPTAWAQDKKASANAVYLAVDTGGHAGPVHDMGFTPDGQRLVSIEDKVVHVWNLSSGERERRWRLPSHLEKLAVAPDGVTVAVATGVEAEAKYRRQITFWILNLRSGEALVHHEDIGYPLSSLEFSPDGKRLAWSTWYQAGVMDHLLKKGRVTHLIERDDLTGWAAFSKDGNQLLVTGGMKKGKQCQAYNVPPPEGALKSVHHLKKPLFELEDSKPKQVQPRVAWRVLWAPDGSRFASWDDEPAAIHLWAPDGKRETTGTGSVRKISLKGSLPHVDFLQFAGPSKLLAAAIVESKTETLKTCLVDLQAPNKIERFQFPVRSEQAPCWAATPDGRYLAVNSGPGFQILVYDLQERKLLHKLGKPQPFPRAVAWGRDSRSIGWAFRKNKDEWSLTAGLNLSTLETLDGNQVRDFTFGHKPLKWKNEGKDEHITLTHDGKSVKTELRGPVNGLAFYKDAADRPHAVLHQKWGENIHLVNLETGKANRIAGDAQRFSVSPDQRYLLVVRGEQMVDIFRIDAKPAQVMKVLVFGSDWIAWSPKGYYAASVGGEELMGWAVKSDEETPLAMYPLERFRKHYYRPDIIKLLLEKGNLPEAEKAANAAAEIKSPTVEIEQALPPIVTLQVDDSKKPLLKVKVSAVAQVKSQPITALRLFMDYQPVTLGEFQDGRDAVKELVKEVTLPGEKPNAAFRLTVMAESKDTYGYSNSVAVEYIDRKKLPVMHVLSIGINDYDVQALKLACAAADAEAILVNFQKAAKGDLFKDVVGKTVLNKKADRTNILSELADLQKQVDDNDLVVLFFAGHGVKDKDDFYLMTKESTSANLAKTALSGSQLRKTLGAFRCQVLLLFDACHSGAFGDRKQGVPGALAGQNLVPATDAAVRDLTEEELGIAVLTAARGGEKAQEKNGHGLFTDAIVKALSNSQGVRLRNHVLYIHNLYAYVLDDVADASEDEQHPYLRMSELVLPFPVAKFDASR